MDLRTLRSRRQRPATRRQSARRARALLEALEARQLLSTVTFTDETTQTIALATIQGVEARRSIDLADTGWQGVNTSDTSEFLTLPQFDIDVDDDGFADRRLTGVSIDYGVETLLELYGSADLFEALGGSEASHLIYNLVGDIDMTGPVLSGLTLDPQSAHVNASDDITVDANTGIWIPPPDAPAHDPAWIVEAPVFMWQQDFNNASSTDTAVLNNFLGTGTLQFTNTDSGLSQKSFGENASSNDQTTRRVIARGAVSITYTYLDIVPTAQIVIAPDATNEVGQDHTFTATVMYDDDLPSDADPIYGGDAFDGLALAEGADVTISLTNGNGAVAVPSGPFNGLADINGEYAATFTSLTGGTVTGHAAADLVVLGQALHVETDGVDQNSVDAVKTFVDAYITIAPDATNEVGQEHTFIATVYEDNGDGIDSDSDGSNFDPAADEFVTIDLSTGASGSGLTDANGEFALTFNSAVPGVITGHAASDVQVGGLSLSRETDGVGLNSVDAVKTYVDAYITITPDATNEVGQDHTFTTTVYVDNGDGIDEDLDGSTYDPADGAAVDVTLTNSNGAVANPAGPFAGNTDINGEYDVTFTSATAGVVTGYATTDVEVGGITLHRETDGTALNSDDAAKTFVDAYITIAPDATNPVGEPHTFIATVYEDNGDGIDSDGDGSNFDPAAGESVTITLTNGGGAVADPAGPITDTSDADGQISATFTSQTAGTVTGHAFSDVLVGGLSLARATDGVGLNSDDAVKTFIANGDLLWLKHDNTGAALGGATFEVTRTLDDVGNPDGTVITVVDNGLNDDDPDIGELQLNDILLGTYTIKETIAPTGWTLDPDTETVVLTADNPSNADATFGDVVPIFVDTQDIGGTATMGFWQNKNGQSVILSGGDALVNFLVTEYPNLFGSGAAPFSSLGQIGKKGAKPVFVNLTGKHASDVALVFLRYFNVTGPHTQAQLMSNVLAAYFDANPTATSTQFGFGDDLFGAAITLTSAQVSAINAVTPTIDLTTNTTVGAYLDAINDAMAGNNGVIPSSIFGVINDISDMINNMNHV